MPDIAATLLRKSARSLDSGRRRCAVCRRVPLVGERLHELEAGEMLCELCVVALPEADCQAIRIERVHAGDRALAVARKAA